MRAVLTDEKKISIDATTGRFWRGGIFLPLISAFFIAMNLIWLFQDSRPPAWDQSHHLLLSLKYYRVLTETKFPLSLKCLFGVSHYYPPFFHISAMPIIALFGFSAHKLILINFFYLIVLVLSIFGIGKLLFNERVGVLSAALTLFYPIMFALSREFLIDFALVSMVTGTQYLILRSRGGFEAKWNIVLGVFAGLALLTKPTAAYFIFPLWAMIVLRKFNKGNVRAFFLSIAIAGFIAVPWYVFSFSDLLKQYASSQLNATRIEGDPVQLLPSFFWYAGAIKSTLMSPVLALFFLIGVGLFMIFNRRSFILMVLISWVLPAFFLLICESNKDSRYIMPALPAFALLTIGGIDALKRPLRNALFFLILWVGYMQINSLYFGIWPSWIKDHQGYYYSYSPDRQDWKNKEALLTLRQFFKNRPLKIGVLPNHERFNPNQFLLYAELLRLPYEVEALGHSSVSFDQIKRYDVFITKYPDVANVCDYEYREKRTKELNAFGMENLGFLKLAEFRLPDNSKAVIYRNSSRSVRSV